MIVNEYYVYTHRKATTGEIFYVGKGKGKRAWRSRNKNVHWVNTVKKHGRHVVIETTDLSCQQALELEKQLIALYGRLDLQLGPLINLTDGGDGGSGLLYTEEMKQVKRKQLQGNKHTLGHKLTPTHKSKISNSLIGNTHTLGKIFSEETKAKMSLSHSGENHHYYGKTRSPGVKAQISAKLKGQPGPNPGVLRTDEVKLKISKTLMSKPKLTCPHCGKCGSVSTMKRYHFGNCKLINH